MSFWLHGDNITGTEPARPGSGSAKAEEGNLRVYPPQLRAGDIITDERGDEWKLIGGATKVAGSLDFGSNGATRRQPARQPGGNPGGTVAGK